MRKEKVVQITSAGRDNGKLFYLREMPATRAEAWGTRALLALARGGVELPDDFMSRGIAGIAIVGVKALGGMEYDMAKPLLEEMLQCVQAVPNPSNPLIRRPLVEDDTEEVATILFLRKEIINLHVDFFTNGVLQNQASAAVQPAQS